MLKTVVIFCAIAAIVSASVALVKVDPIPEKYKGQQGCYLAEFDKVFPFGSSTPSKAGCKEYRCGQELMEIADCGAVIVHKPCYTVTDESKPYPECCPKPKCPDNKEMLS